MFTIKAIYRFTLRHALRPLIQRKGYSPNSDVPNYWGWMELPLFGCIAFIRDDGSLQYRW